MKEFPKVYEHLNVEDKWYEAWQEQKIFTADINSNKPAYSILMPPPNVTGILHFGHVLNQTLQDLYIRYKRMQGFEVCWFPGTDHAGIATQTRVEAELKKEGISKYDLGREKFTDKVWEWRDKYGGIILKQLRKLGVSADWSRTLFTMDEGPSNAVKDVFVRLYDEGLIYKGKRIINWSPLAQTALSDEEVEFREVKEHLYTLRYYFEDNSGYLQVATVRPETIFGDVAVAVNPNDERFISLIGSKVRVPLTERYVPIIADDYADPTFGTGCVKITPAHDPNDFMVGGRHNLDMPNTINPDGTLNELTGEFNGLERFKARKAILKKLEEAELVEKIDDYTHNVGFSQRGGEPVEPYLSDQWFVKMQPLAEKALELVLNGDVKFYPNHWVKTYQHWMSNIKDWCISRQLWWGHRIPVYYTEDGRLTAARNEQEAREKLGIDSSAKLKQEDDVLDTWFSSWLWPLTTMNWLADGTSEETPELKKFLPTDLLVTGPDIIFFWVARMIMATSKFKNEIPFKDVYFTSTIRDGKGRKLSKSLGNSPDPLEIIHKYGADAVRFTIIYLSPMGQDVKMDVDVKQQDIPSMEIGRNFANKIWNAGRFLLMKYAEIEAESDNFTNDDLSQEQKTTADIWIESRFQSTIEKLNKYLDNYKVTEYSKELYDFIWRDFCDWYVEIVKVQFNESNDLQYKRSLLKHAIDIYGQVLHLLHPVMPYITEEIWHLISDANSTESISVRQYPAANEELIKAEIETGFEFTQKVIEEIRSMRAGANVPPSVKVPAVIKASSEEIREFLKLQSNIIMQLGKISELVIAYNINKPSLSLVSLVQGTEIYLKVGDLIDLEKEISRLQKEVERYEFNISSLQTKLNNEKFVNNAPIELVASEKAKLNSMQDTLNKLRINIENLK